MSCRTINELVLQDAIVKATDTDSVATGQRRNLGVRCFSNAFTDAYTAREIAGAPKEELMAMGTGTNRKGIVEGDIVNGTVMCGQSLNVLNDILPCKDVMERIIAEAKEAIANVQKIELYELKQKACIACCVPIILDVRLRYKVKRCMLFYYICRSIVSDLIMKAVE